MTRISRRVNAVEGNVVLVTGAASSHGRAICTHLEPKSLVRTSKMPLQNWIEEG
jgi:FlaA1/EpsC-like NDP-sugar epimerase